MTLRMLSIAVVLTGFVLSVRAQGPQADSPKRDSQVNRTSMIWQLPDDRIGIRTAPILIMSRDDVASELKLTPEQRKKTWDKIAELGKRVAELKGRSDADARVLRRSIDQMHVEWLKAELSPEQLARLTQIDLQWEGPAAMISRPQVSESLQLSADQKKKIQGLIQQNMAGRSGADPLQARSELTRVVFRELDETQQQAWRSLVGPDFQAVPRTALAK